MEETEADRPSPPQLEPVAVTGVARDTANVPLHPDQINRLWQHGMHEERLFHDRLN